MKELAFGDNEMIESIEPIQNIIREKESHFNEYFEIEDTGARVSLRDSKQLIEVFCKAADEMGPHMES